jgi:hypothetical protein
MCHQSPPVRSSCARATGAAAHPCDVVCVCASRNRGMRVREASSTRAGPPLVHAQAVVSSRVFACRHLSNPFFTTHPLTPAQRVALPRRAGLGTVAAAPWWGWVGVRGARRGARRQRQTVHLCASPCAAQLCREGGRDASLRTLAAAAHARTTHGARARSAGARGTARRGVQAPGGLARRPQRGARSPHAATFRAACRSLT